MVNDAKLFPTKIKADKITDKVFEGDSHSQINFFVICIQFVIFKPLSYYFEETIGFDVKPSFASRPESRLIE